MAQRGPVTNEQGKIVKADGRNAAIVQLLEKNKLAFERALPRHVSVDRLMRLAMGSLRRTPKLLQCQPLSLVSAIMQAAILGLEPDNGLGHAYLVPFKDECTLIPGYKGLLLLARNSGQISTISATVVREGDAFDYELGDSPFIKHKPAAKVYTTTTVKKTKRIDGKDVEVDEDVEVERPITHVYAISRLRDGGVQREVMTIEEVEHVRRRSRAANDGPWVTDYEAMVKKTALRRLCKMLPASVEMQRAVALDEENAAGLAQTFEFSAEDLISDAEIVAEPPASPPSTGSAA